MAKLVKDARAVFPIGGQQAFLKVLEQKIGVAAIAHICRCSERTVRDWRREKFSMPLAALHALAARARVSVPKNISIRAPYAHIAKASRMGMAAVIQKYGGIPRNEARRAEHWRQWWESTGKFKEERNPLFIEKKVHLPRRSAELAEFIGIMMGDGGISRYQVIVTLHHTDDAGYVPFVTNRIKTLFRINPRIYHSPKNSVNDIAVSRIELVRFLHTLGLPIGNKISQGLDIPDWIRRNRKFARACLRGLVDTDGSIFTHRYCIKGVWYSYKKLSFTSASEPLRRSVYALLREFGLHPRMTGKDVRLDRVKDMERYFSYIGSHNPKHLRRYGNAVG